MSLVLPRVAGPARRGDVLLTAGIAGLAIAYSAAILLSGDALLLVPLLGAVVVVAIAARPVVGVYLLFGIAILLEQFVILGLQPITVGTHVYQNLSAYTEIPLRLSIVDLLLLLTAISWAAQCSCVRRISSRPISSAAAPICGSSCMSWSCSSASRGCRAS